MVALEIHPAGVVLPVRASPGARTAGIRGHQQGALKVSVTVAAEKGKANKALVEVLCKQLSLRRSQLELLSGATATQKRFLVRGISRGELAGRIRHALPSHSRKM